MTFPQRVEARAKQEGAVAVVISAKIESEIAVLSRRSAPNISRPWVCRKPASTG